MKRSCFSLCRLLYVICSLLLLSACSHDGENPAPNEDMEITSIYPEAAAGGDTIKIYGKHLTTGIKTHISASLNGENVAILSVSPDSLQAVVPEMAGSGQLVVTVNGQSFQKSFTYHYVATVTTIAGSGEDGRDDGVGTAATFNCPWGITVDSSNGTLYVADVYNRLIRKVTRPGNVVTTIPISYEVDFSSPYNITVDQHSRQLYLTDFGNHVLRVEPDGTNVLIYQGPVHALAGIALGQDQHLYVGNNIDGTITRLDTSGSNATEFATGLWTPRNLVFDKGGNLWAGAYDIAKISPAGQVSFVPRDHQFAGWEIALDRRGNIYEANHFDNKLRMIEKSTGSLIDIAGSGNAEDVDGVGLNASFNGPQGLTIDKAGNLYMTTYNYETSSGNKIRKITVR